MTGFLQRFTPREQLSLLALALALAIYLLYQVLWLPMHDARSEMQRRNTSTAEVLQRVDAMVSEVLYLRSTGTAAPKRGSLTGVINRTTAQFSLPVSRLQPNSRGDLQVRFEAVSFDDLLQWMHRLETVDSILINEVSISQSGGPGRVNATLQLAQSS